MGPLFFKLDRDFDSVAKIVFNALDIKDVLQGESLNALGGVYYKSSVFGMNIKIEENSYEYEDCFNYTLFVKKNFDAAIKITDEIERSMLNLIVNLLSINLNIEIGMEKDGELLIIPPPSINI